MKKNPSTKLERVFFEARSSPSVFYSSPLPDQVSPTLLLTAILRPAPSPVGPPHRRRSEATLASARYRRPTIRLAHSLVRLVPILIRSARPLSRRPALSTISAFSIRSWKWAPRQTTDFASSLTT
jgi:hypothetical protein